MKSFLENKKTIFSSINIVTAFVFIIMLSFLSCNKNDPFIPVENEEFAFELLRLEKDTIQKGETSTIEAIAKGIDLTYNWSARAGDILGSGSKVIYGATPCAVGEILIKCEIKDASNNSAKKTVKIFIKQ